MVKNFYIFRHGQSSYNLEGRIQGHTNNSVLTNQGIDCLLYTSPSPRD